MSLQEKGEGGLRHTESGHVQVEAETGSESHTRGPGLEEAGKASPLVPSEVQPCPHLDFVDPRTERE